MIMEEKHDACHGSAHEKDCLRIFERFGNQMGLAFHRAIFYDTGRLEIEFQARNPIECLVLKLNSWEAALDLLKKTPKEIDKFDCAVLRKKCTKCFVHEREAAIAEMG
jgi:hypothetical protein